MTNIYLIFVCTLCGEENEVYGHSSLYLDSSIAPNIVSINDKQISMARAKYAPVGS